jgi:hypothetical protein
MSDLENISIMLSTHWIPASGSFKISSPDQGNNRKGRQGRRPVAKIGPTSDVGRADWPFVNASNQAAREADPRYREVRSRLQSANFEGHQHCKLQELLCLSWSKNVVKCGPPQSEVSTGAQVDGQDGGGSRRLAAGLAGGAGQVVAARQARQVPKDASSRRVTVSCSTHNLLSSTLRAHR